MILGLCACSGFRALDRGDWVLVWSDESVQTQMVNGTPIETVKPALLGLEDEMADHGLVREIARSLDVQNIRDFGGWTAGTYFAVASSTALDALATGLVASAAGGAATMGVA